MEKSKVHGCCDMCGDVGEWDRYIDRDLDLTLCPPCRSGLMFEFIKDTEITLPSES